MLEEILGGDSSAVGVCRSKALQVVMLGVVRVFLVFNLPVKQGDKGTTDHLNFGLMVACKEGNQGIFRDKLFHNVEIRTESRNQSWTDTA